MPYSNCTEKGWGVRESSEVRRREGERMGEGGVECVSMETQMTVIWMNINDHNINSKQDSIFNCCQGLQFEAWKLRFFFFPGRRNLGLLSLSPTTKDDTKSHLTRCIVK